MKITLEGLERLRFASGAPVRAASAVAPLGDGFLVVQDDATHGAWFRDGPAVPVRILPATDGLETFDSESGTKHLKPDLEAACQVAVDGEPGLLLLGSGSSRARMRWSLMNLRDGQPLSRVADMTPLYAIVGDVLDVEPDLLNMEGADVLDGTLRWFHRGLPSAGLPPGSVDLPLAATLDAVAGRLRPEEVPVRNPHRYELGEAEGVGLAITDAVALPTGGLLVSAAAEDSPNPRDDGPVVGSALALLDGTAVVDTVALPRVEGRVAKVEGLMLVEASGSHVRLLAVSDADDPATPSVAMRLHVTF